jgi:hypothetical protein
MSDYASLIDKYSSHYGLPSGLLARLVGAESAYNPSAVSPVGARGLTQIMPATAADPGYGIQPLQNDSDEENVRFGAEYLSTMLNKFDGSIPHALAAYNAGPGFANNWDGNMETLYPETRNYIGKIMGDEFSLAATDNTQPIANKKTTGQFAIDPSKGAIGLREFAAQSSREAEYMARGAGQLYQQGQERLGMNYGLQYNMLTPEQAAAMAMKSTAFDIYEDRAPQGQSSIPPEIFNNMQPVNYDPNALVDSVMGPAGMPFAPQKPAAPAMFNTVPGDTMGYGGIESAPSSVSTQGAGAASGNPVSPPEGTENPSLLWEALQSLGIGLGQMSGGQPVNVSEPFVRRQRLEAWQQEQAQQNYQYETEQAQQAELLNYNRSIAEQEAAIAAQDEQAALAAEQAATEAMVNLATANGEKPETIAAIAASPDMREQYAQMVNSATKSGGSEGGDIPLTPEQLSAKIAVAEANGASPEELANFRINPGDLQNFLDNRVNNRETDAERRAVMFEDQKAAISAYGAANNWSQERIAAAISSPTSAQKATDEIAALDAGTTYSSQEDAMADFAAMEEMITGAELPDSAASTIRSKIAAGKYKATRGDLIGAKAAADSATKLFDEAASGDITTADSIQLKDYQATIDKELAADKAAIDTAFQNNKIDADTRAAALKVAADQAAAEAARVANLDAKQLQAELDVKVATDKRLTELNAEHDAKVAENELMSKHNVAMVDKNYSDSEHYDELKNFAATPGVTPAMVMDLHKTLTAPERMEEEAMATDLGQRRAAVTGALGQLNLSVNRQTAIIDKLLALDPAVLENILGPFQGLNQVPAVRQASRDAIAMLNQLEGGAFLTVYESLRGANAITDTEGVKATAALTTIGDRTQSVEAYTQALRDYRDSMTDTVTIATAFANGEPIPEAGQPPVNTSRTGVWNPETGEVDFE